MTDQLIAKHPFNRKHVRSALNGNADSLMCAFLWKESPQGPDFWGQQCVGLWGEEKLSPQARCYLEHLLDCADKPIKPIFVRERVKEAIKGDGAALAAAFPFDHTEQGEKYWLKEVVNLKNGGSLQPASLDYLQFLLTEKPGSTKEVKNLGFKDPSTKAKVGFITRVLSKLFKRN